MGGGFFAFMSLCWTKFVCCIQVGVVQAYVGRSDLFNWLCFLPQESKLWQTTSTSVVVSSSWWRNWDSLRFVLYLYCCTLFDCHCILWIESESRISIAWTIHHLLFIVRVVHCSQKLHNGLIKYLYADDLPVGFILRALYVSHFGIIKIKCCS